MKPAPEVGIQSHTRALERAQGRGRQEAGDEPLNGFLHVAGLGTEAVHAVLDVTNDGIFGYRFSDTGALPSTTLIPE